MNGEIRFGKEDMVVDSTLLVDVARGKIEAKNFFDVTPGQLLMSRAGMMELIRGSRTKKELHTLIKLIKSLGLETVEISESISETAGRLFQDYWHNHGLGAMDAFIAATAIATGEKLATHNIKHFKFIDRLEIVKPY